MTLKLPKLFFYKLYKPIEVVHRSDVDTNCALCAGKRLVGDIEVSAELATIHKAVKSFDEPSA